MATTKKTATYRYRGPIERGSRRGYKWHDGFSEDSAGGRPLYPWMTKRECQHDAKVHGKKAVFVGR